MIADRCLWCDRAATRGPWCDVHAGRWQPGHRGHPPERIRELRRRLAAFVGPIRFPRWIRLARERYGLSR